MTKPEAESWCQDFMNQSPGYVACKDVPNVDQSRAVEICVLDILVIILFLILKIDFVITICSFFLHLDYHPIY